MNALAIAAVASAALAVFVGLFSQRIAVAPGSADQRPLGVVALACATYAICTLVGLQAPPPAAAALASRLHLSSATVQLWGWLHFSRAFLRAERGRLERVASGALLPVAAAALVPGLLFERRVEDHAWPWLGASYRDAPPTALGVAAMAGMAVVALAILVRLARAWRRAVPNAGLLTAALGVLVVVGISELLAAGGLVDAPYLLDVGFAAPVLAAGWFFTGRFVESTRALERLRGRLEADVDARTRELAVALEALHQAEKLAAVGQFANGVAHEVNSPAAVVMTNLRYLEEASRGGALPADAGEVVRDALASMWRINDLVRKLVDAGRVGTIPGPPSTVSVAEVITRAVAGARASLGARVAISVDAARELVVRARRESIEQVLSSLLANAGDAIPPDRAGHVAVRAERTEEGVRITVADDGVGMTPEVLRRAFDPFFTTKPAGHGAGLGLSVARGLVEAHAGSLRLESAPGAGTTAIVELPQAAPLPPPPAA